MIEKTYYPIGLMSLLLAGGFFSTSLQATESKVSQAPPLEQANPPAEPNDVADAPQEATPPVLSALPETKKLDAVERAQGPAGRKLPTRLSLQERKQRRAEQDAARAAEQAKAQEEANAVPAETSEEKPAIAPRRPMGGAAGFNPFAGGGLKPGDVQLRPARPRSSEPAPSPKVEDESARARASTQPSAEPVPQTDVATLAPAPRPLAIQRASAESLLADAGKLDKGNKDAVQRLLSRMDVFMNRASPEDKTKLQGIRDSLNDIVNPTAQRIIRK